MKKLIILIPFLALSLVACNSKKEQKAAKNLAENVPVSNMKGLKIAYYIQDSLKTGYKYYAHIDSTVKVKQLAFQRELEKRQAALQNYAASNQEKYEKGLLSAFDVQKVQEEAQRRQDAFLQYQQTEGQKIDQQTQDYLNVLTNRIDDAAKKYCKEKGINILMMHGSGSGLTYIDSTMDVTDDFINYLNEYQAELDKSIGKGKK